MGITSVTEDFGMDKSNLNPLLYDIQEKLLQIKAFSEVNRTDQALKITNYALASIEYATFALRAKQQSLPMTSFSASAIVDQTRIDLTNLAREYGVELHFEASKSLDLIYTNPFALKGAVFCLVSSVINSNYVNEAKGPLVMAVQHTKDNFQRIGVYGSNLSIKPSHFSKSLDLIEKSRMLAPEVSSGSGVNLSISSYLVEALGLQLRSFKHKGLSGIGLYVPVSKQLSLV